MNSGSCSQISSSCNCPIVSTLNFLSSRIHQDKSFHCEVCNVCLDKRLEGNHKCRPDSGHDECCICLEVSFNLLRLFQIAIISSSFNECFFKYESKPKECRRRNRMVVDAVSVTFFLLSELLLRVRRLVHISNARVLRYMFCKAAVAVNCNADTIVFSINCRMHSVVARYYHVHTRFIENAQLLWYKTACKLSPYFAHDQRLILIK